MNITDHNRVGILVGEEADLPWFVDSGFYSLLIRHGNRLGLDVYVITPSSSMSEGTGMIGYRYSAAAGTWSEEPVPLPDLVYDRVFQKDARGLLRYRSSLVELRRKQDFILLGNGLPGKWKVHQALLREPGLRRLVPRTVRLQDASLLVSWFRSCPSAFLKPDSGTQGKGAIRIIKQEDSGLYYLEGRDFNNKPFAHKFHSVNDLVSWVRRFASRRYLLQPNLNLISRSGDVYDVRSLVQKNGEGRWTLTGMAVRRGSSGSVTANLHGGGSAEAAEPFLQEQFGTERGKEKCALLRSLSLLIAEHLEGHFGRLAELGIDFGVDQDGRIWLIEVNSKPGRSVFRLLCDEEARRNSLAYPMAYASYLLAQRGDHIWRNHRLRFPLRSQGTTGIKPSLTINE
ncbi:MULTISPECIES: YheC/YheD family endospore coat-associated protein [Paenibacillus]|uniref:YheC/YheD family protein n=1 Tax=Paenibacillus residui TaxID=629724 RepID=A0ABW3DIB2_9BACL